MTSQSSLRQDRRVYSGDDDVRTEDQNHGESSHGRPLSFRYGQDPSTYPLDGVQYALKHRELWKQIGRISCLSIFISLVVLVLIFIFALVPQAKVIGGKQWWSWIVAVILVIMEANLVLDIALPVVQSNDQIDIFLKTMRKEQRWNQTTMRLPTSTSSLQNAISNKQIRLLRILLAPIRIVPFVGDAIYSGIIAVHVGWEYMDPYFEAIQLSYPSQRLEVFQADSCCSALCSQSFSFDSSIRNNYLRFGFVCAYLECISLIGPSVFPFTNTIGAALFACDIERCGGPSGTQQTMVDELSA